MTARVLNADAYDTIELSALANGGIGAMHVFQNHDEFRPVCVYGHCSFACNTRTADTPLFAALRDAGIDSVINDRAVRAINRRNRGRGGNGRVSFSDWCAELGVVRGGA